MTYQIAHLVKSGFDFKKVFPEKQQFVAEATKMDFDLDGIVKYLQAQTSNFTIDNPVAKDLDTAIFSLVREFTQQSGGAVPEPQPEPAQPSPPSGPSPSGEAPTIEDLELRIRNMEKRLKKTEAGDAKDDLELRIKNMKKRLAKM